MAVGASALERTICATAGYTGTAMTHGIAPEVDPEEWVHARHLLGNAPTFNDNRLEVELT